MSARTGRAQTREVFKNIKPLTLQYLVEHPGSVVFLKDIAEFIRKANGSVREASIQTAITGMIEEGKPIEVESRGQAWRYQPNVKKNKRLFEELTTTKAGVILVEDEEGNVYKLEEL